MPTMNAPTLASSSPATTRDFLAALRRSGAFTARQCERLAAAIRDGRYPDEPRRLARALVRGGILTEYQARRLLHCAHPGLALGRYVILDRLGAGAMGRVYRARHRLMGREVALKVIEPGAAAGPNARARFRREMRLVGRLDHPNIVRAFDADQVGPVLYLVMEYLPGRGLDRVLEDRGGPLPVAEAVGYAAQAALGLAHAHARGVVHRDIKPSNLLVDAAGVIKVLDFGIAAMSELRAGDSQASLTADGLAVGTVEYMAPEQARGLPADGRSDLYSLGCVLYHLLTGRLPFPADSKIAGLALRVLGRPTPMAELRPDLPPDVIAVVERLMATRPEDRYQQAAEAAAALRDVADRLAAPVGAAR